MTTWGTFRTFAACLLLVTVAAGPAVAQDRADIAEVAPICPASGPPRTLVAQPRSFEAAAFDQRGRLLISDWLGNAVDMLEAPETTPRTVASVPSPGGIAPLPDGQVLVGAGASVSSALQAPASGAASLLRLDPDTGALTPYADGLSMSNGVVRAADGTVYASNDIVPALDRVDPDGTVHRGWFRETPTNGLALSPDDRTLYANVSFGDTRILAIDTATGAARTYFRPPPGFGNAFFDDLDIDAQGRLYAPMYLAGQVWRIDTDGAFCALATGLALPAGITVGTAESAFAADSVFVTTHTGQIIELPHAIPHSE
ncbi:SMP-30/gluconolactonase/LRE family protein [Nocardia sp. NBC_00416]|uniref:SMP-30/gluconolactonase/LRE family protein n=1 Tax=Nocardia sp. NBC_00416 TaxID=2975991 RepID=UPI002E1E8760